MWLYDGGDTVNWWLWQELKRAEGAVLPHDHYARFNQFIVETVAPIPIGEVHMHAFYDNRRKTMYWSPTTHSSIVCKQEGRCVVVNISTIEEELPL